jgi:hypothetical protein
VRGFGELETVVMDQLWSLGGSATVREVLEPLRAERTIGVGVADRVQRLLVPPDATRAWLTQTLTVGLLLLGPVIAGELIMTRSLFCLSAMS